MQSCTRWSWSGAPWDCHWLLLIHSGRCTHLRLSLTPQSQHYTCTVEPPNKGHIGTRSIFARRLSLPWRSIYTNLHVLVVLCTEVVLISEGPLYRGCTVAHNQWQHCQKALGVVPAVVWPYYSIVSRSHAPVWHTAIERLVLHPPQKKPGATKWLVGFCFCPSGVIALNQVTSAHKSLTLSCTWLRTNSVPDPFLWVGVWLHETNYSQTNILSSKA